MCLTPLPLSAFQLLHTDSSSSARAGVLQTAHGLIETPVFMPVGTQATVKAATPRDLVEAQAQIILGNTYHLYLRPGMAAMREFGGLHRFMSWSKPILTDSGGFQVFSLAKLREMTESGVRFRSHIDGSEFFLGPRESIEMQMVLGSDVMMVLDECPPWPCDRGAMESAVQRTIRWAQASKEAKHQLLTERSDWPTQGQLLFGIVQGGSDTELRRHCAEQLVNIGFDGYAIGGVSVGEPEEEMMKAVDLATPFLPTDHARYAMGLGQPDQLIELVARGVDMFDCVLPTRMARHGQAYTHQGCFCLKNAPYRLDQRPIEEDCGCPACTQFSRAYIRHLLKAEEILGVILLSLHNLHFYLKIMREARQAILENRFASFRLNFREKYKTDTKPT